MTLKSTHGDVTSHLPQREKKDQEEYHPACVCRREKIKKFYALQGPLHKAWPSTEVGLAAAVLLNQ
jgi:hypothetical protein